MLFPEFDNRAIGREHARWVNKLDGAGGMDSLLLEYAKPLRRLADK